ncbi:hypothetical protein [Streptomyces sp. NPDC002324]
MSQLVALSSALVIGCAVRATAPAYLVAVIAAVLTESEGRRLHGDVRAKPIPPPTPLTCGTSPTHHIRRLTDSPEPFMNLSTHAVLITEADRGLGRAP